MLSTQSAQEEKQAIERVLGGDREAYTVLVERYGGPLFRYLLRMLGRHEEAEDVVQEAFLRAYLALASYDPRYRFSTWLFRIATNLALNRLRDERRVISLEGLAGDSEGLPLELEDHWDEGRPEAAVEQKELLYRIRECLEELPPAYRLVVALRYVADLSYEEIAEVTGLPLNTVRSRLHRGRERLGECLEKHGFRGAR